MRAKSNDAVTQEALALMDETIQRQVTVRDVTEHAFIVLLDVPPGLEFGVDFVTWTTGTKCMGIKLLPPTPGAGPRRPPCLARSLSDSTRSLSLVSLAHTPQLCT